MNGSRIKNIVQICFISFFPPLQNHKNVACCTQCQTLIFSLYFNNGRVSAKAQEFKKYIWYLQSIEWCSQKSTMQDTNANPGVDINRTAIGKKCLPVTAPRIPNCCPRCVTIQEPKTLNCRLRNKVIFVRITNISDQLQPKRYYGMVIWHCLFLSTIVNREFTPKWSFPWKKAVAVIGSKGTEWFYYS